MPRYWTLARRVRSEDASVRGLLLINKVKVKELFIDNIMKGIKVVALLLFGFVVVVLCVTATRIFLYYY